MAGIVNERKIFIVTPNPEIIVRAQKDLELAKILNQASFALPDGAGVVLASGGRLEKRIAGADFAEDLIRVCAEKGWRVFLLGGKEGVAEKAAANLKRKFGKNNIKLDQNFEIKSFSGPKLTKEGRPIGKREAEREREAIRRINNFKPHVLLIGFGAPRQEKWLYLHFRKLRINVGMVVGGAFDFWAGKVPRAPKIMQELSLEWLWRLVREPWRIKRQLMLINFVWMVVKSKKVEG